MDAAAKHIINVVNKSAFLSNFYRSAVWQTIVSILFQPLPPYFLRFK